MKKLLTVIAFGFLVSTAAVAGEPRAHIEEATAKFVAAFNAGDAAGVAGLYTDDAAIFPPGGERIDGRAAIQAFWQGAIESGLKIDDISAVEVHASSDMADDVGTLLLTVPGDSGPTKVAGKYFVIWKRTGHTWQLHRDIWNTN